MMGGGGVAHLERIHPVGEQKARTVSVGNNSEEFTNP